MTNKLKTFHLEFNTDLIVGHLDLKHKRLPEVVTYFNKHFNYYIITRETSSKNKQHLHFIASLPTIELASFKSDKYLLKKFPELKRLKDNSDIEKRGGEHKYQIKYIKEITQMYYIFKDCTEDNQPYYAGCWMDWRVAQQNYQFCLKSKKHAMIMWIMNTNENYKELTLDQFLYLYVEYNELHSVKQETFSNFEKHYNIYLRIFNKQKLKLIYKQRYEKLYN